MGTKFRSLTIVVGLLCTAVLSVHAQAPGPGSGSNVFTVAETQGASTVSLGGTVVPYQEVTLAAQLPGRVKLLAGKEGDAFEKGTLLVALDEAELLAQRQAAVAAWRSADSQLRSAGVMYNREMFSPQSRSDMGGMGMPSMFDQMFTRPMQNMMGQRSTGYERYSDWYSAGTRVDQARDAMIQAQSQIQAVDAKRRDAKSVAPFDGVITDKFIEVGDVVQPGQPLIKFADIQDLQIEVDVPARLMPGVKLGMVMQAELDVGGAQVPAQVERIFPKADPQRHTVKVKFDLEEGAPAAPGMYAKVRVPDFSAPSRNLPYIPRAAIQYRGSLPGVFVMNEQNQPELRLIRLGEPLDATHVTVLSGLRAGARILVKPTSRSGPSGWTPGVPPQR